MDRPTSRVTASGTSRGSSLRHAERRCPGAVRWAVNGSPFAGSVCRSRLLGSVLGLRRACLPHDVLGGLELEGRMVDVEVVGEARPEVIEHVAGFGIRAQDDMR